MTCEDINECAKEPKICSHLCTNNDGSFTCGCYSGYLLRSDRKSCKAIGDPMYILFSSTNEIRKLSPSQNSLELLFNEGTQRITGLDISFDEGYLYFSIELGNSIFRYLFIYFFNNIYMYVFIYAYVKDYI